MESSGTAEASFQVTIRQLLVISGAAINIACAEVIPGASSVRAAVFVVDGVDVPEQSAVSYKAIIASGLVAKLAVSPTVSTISSGAPLMVSGGDGGASQCVPPVDTGIGPTAASQLNA